MGRVPAVVGIDLGTSEAKAALVGLDGCLLALGRGTYSTDVAADGRAEQDPRDWFAAIIDAVGALATALAEAEVLAIACVGQGPTLVAVNAAGDPVR
ncbi:MAG: FGGY family carbohydrate kinase, partial [Chloroflexota bacterium]